MNVECEKFFHSSKEDLFGRWHIVTNKFNGKNQLLQQIS
jgi:hypothetical protein